MLTREENELLCRVGPGTPMGTMLRRYWVPACLSDELPEPEGFPIRLRLLGEDLVAFRDSQGSIGVLDEFCSHRCASLALGRNEEGGLRCIYHGWKYDVAGNILEMPTEPEGSKFQERIKHLAYPTREQGGFIWIYMGPEEKVPPFPEFEWTTMPKSQRAAGKLVGEANFIQAIEGGIDSAHAPILHKSEIMPSADSPYPSGDTRPRLEVEDTDYGFCYAAIRMAIEDPENKRFVRITQFIAPFYATVAVRLAQIFVPIDDYHTASYLVLYDPNGPVDQDYLRTLQGLRIAVDLDASYRPLRNRANDWLRDRKAMKRGESWTGIHGILMQDNMVQESMGPIVNRTKEHLGATDAAVIRMRRLMIDSVRRVQNGGDPIGLDRPFDYSKIRDAAGLIHKDTPWQALLEADAEEQGRYSRYQMFVKR